MKQVMKRILPAAIQERLRRTDSGQIVFSGNYDSWEAALHDSTGYDAPLILARTREAMLRVKNGEAIFERDSVLLEKPDFPFPIITGMLREAIASDGRLSVLDFGGALGSSYFQCRSFFTPLKSLRWHVIEQAAHVACGRCDFESEELRFHETIDECLSTKPDLNVLLLSGVLPYLKNPYRELENLVRLDVPTLIIDRTAFLPGDQDRLTVEQVPADIYRASYPFWFLSEGKFQQAIGKQYRTVASFSPVDAPLLAKTLGRFEGFIFERADRD